MGDAKPWFRMYHEFATDPIMQSLAFEDQRHFVVLLCLKCNGVLDRSLKGANRDRIIYRSLGLDSHAAEEAKIRLQEVKLIDKKWQPIAWNKRQFISDTSAKRTRKYRNSKETSDDIVTNSKSHRDAPETEAETDKEIPLKPPLPNWLNSEVWQEFEKHRKELRKPLTSLSRTKNLAVLEKLSFDEQRDAVDATIANRWVGLFPPKEKTNAKTQRNLSAPDRVRAANTEQAARRNVGEGY